MNKKTLEKISSLIVEYMKAYPGTYEAYYAGNHISKHWAEWCDRFAEAVAKQKGQTTHAQIMLPELCEVLDEYNKWLEDLPTGMKSKESD